MATEIKDAGAKKRKEQWRYPWDEWTNGNRWILYRGVDFPGQVKSFQNRVHGIAGKRGLKATTETSVIPLSEAPAEVQEKLGDLSEVEILDIQFYDPSIEAQTAA